MPAGPNQVRCSSVISESPVEECDFHVPGPCLGLPFVRIGASGTPNDGQSTWNVVAHQRMWSLGGLQDMFAARLPWSHNEEADRLYKELVDHGLRLPATHPNGSPYHRWTYCTRQSSFWGSREFTLNVEDYAGEIVRGMAVEDLCRQRLLDCDGLVMFVGPTKKPDHYLSALDSFFADLRARRCRSVNQIIDVPVALIVPKIDMLAETVADDGAASRIAKLIDEIRGCGPNNEGTTLQAIERRSMLIRKLPPEVMPMDRVVAMAEAVVGRDRVMVFPVATLGWHESPVEHLGSLGSKAAHDWLLEHAFGVLDPLLWLLHRLGMRRLPTR